MTKETKTSDGMSKTPKDGPPSKGTTVTTPLVWMDLEMTGLDPETDVIIEIATVITDSQLNVIAEGPDIVIKRDPALFSRMDAWNQEQHTKSGLWTAVINSTITESEAEKQTLDFLKKYVAHRESPLCGNSVWQDRRFLGRYMKQVEAHLHYRLIDVSTLKELGSRWHAQKSSQFTKKKNAHRALDDVYESIEELKFYRDALFIKDAQP
jgi:oligoribonuclease